MDDPIWSQDSSVSMGTMLNTRWPRNLGSIPKRDSPQARDSFPGAKAAEVKNAWSYTSIPLRLFIAWCCIKLGIASTHLVFSWLITMYGSPIIPWKGTRKAKFIFWMEKNSDCLSDALDVQRQKAGRIWEEALPALLRNGSGKTRKN
jgi:hypothetical protein